METPKAPYELFGVECGPGWNKLIDPLIQRCQAEGVAILQIKEKFGGLRFYVGACTMDLAAAIEEAEHQSYVTCEICGEAGKSRGIRGWIRTLCDAHAEKPQ